MAFTSPFWVQLDCCIYQTLGWHHTLNMEACYGFLLWLFYIRRHQLSGILSDYEAPERLHGLENVTGASIHILVHRWNFIFGWTVPLRTLHWFCTSGVPRMPWGKEKILTMWPGTVVLSLYCCMCPWAAAWDRSMETNGHSKQFTVTQTHSAVRDQWNWANKFKKILTAGVMVLVTLH